MISFKRLLPKTMQDTRWGSLTEVWQSIWNDIKIDKIKLIVNQYDPSEISSDDLKDLAVMFGYNLTSLEGYTETEFYLKKQLETLVNRIKSKSTPLYYQYQGIPYNLLSNGYTVVYDNITGKYIVDETLLGISHYGTIILDREDPGNQYYINVVTADMGLLADSTPLYYSDTAEIVIFPTGDILDPTTLDAFDFPFLDGGMYLYNLSRNFVYDYKHNFVENESEFLSLNTLTALHNDINQFKKITDRCYFEPNLFFDFEGRGVVTDVVWTDFSGGSSVTQKNILMRDSFENWSQIRIGNGSHSIIDESIQDVSSFVQRFTRSGDVVILTDNSGEVICRTLISEGNIYYPDSYSGSTRIDGQYFSGFTEISVWDNASGCILYSTFPKIQWEPTMYSNIKFNFQII